MSADTIRKAAVSVVIAEGDGEEPDRVLCVWNRRYRTWSLPGGMVEDGESPEQAQARELEEETGLLTSSAKRVHEGPHGQPHKPGRASVVVVFLVEAIGEPREVEDGCPVQWMTVPYFVAQSAFGSFYAGVLSAIVAEADKSPLPLDEEDRALAHEHPGGPRAVTAFGACEAPIARQLWVKR